MDASASTGRASQRPAKRGPEHVLDGYRQHARRGIRTIVDVLAERELPEREPIARRTLAARTMPTGSTSSSSAAVQRASLASE
jgi:hypothetical protein